GLDDGDIARVRGPIGLDLGGRDPAETALAVMAEIVAARRGGSGVPMRERLADERLANERLAAERPAAERLAAG
ncbi:MAG TPA: XdhC family protein, partial [Candidatus Limnocylindrales bacterium]